MMNFTNFTYDHSILEFYDKSKLHILDKLLNKCYNTSDPNSSTMPDKNAKGAKNAFCPRLFDGFLCWDETPAASIASQNCPEHITGFDPQRLAFKRCSENGTWFVHPSSQKPWTNYTTCVDNKDLLFRKIINEIYVGGYALSVIALIFALLIFTCFRSLHCTRIKVHRHLFTSFALNNILWIIWYKTVVNRVEVIQANSEWCQVLHVVCNYFMVTSYFWMFCEGLHLHIVLVVVFFKEELAMISFIVFGWGISLCVVLLYAFVRFNTPHATDRCWIEDSQTFWIIIVPVAISLVASFMFLVNVVKVLLAKLPPAPNQQIAVAAKKATRAALILIPLFGLHFMLLPLRPPANTVGEKIYDIISALLTSLQGFCVSVLYCFTNHEVIVAVRAQIARHRRQQDPIAMTARRNHGATGGDSLANTRENIV